MHAGTLVKLAAVVASQNHILRSRPQAADWWAGEQYWVVSKSRLLHWAGGIKSFQEKMHDPCSPGPTQLWSQTEPLLEEMLLAEVCARVWCATLSVVDHHLLPGELDPVARSVFLGHLEARRRALQLIVFGRGLQAPSADSLNQLRRDCECWTDMLLSNLVPCSIARQFAFDPQRMRNWSGRGRRHVARRANLGWSALLTSLDVFLATRPAKPAVCGELNAELGRWILARLPEGCFDACGNLRVGWYLDPFQSDVAAAANIGALLCGMGRIGSGDHEARF